MNRELIKSATHTAWWIIKIIIPVSFIVTLLNHYGIIQLLSTYTEPAFQLIGLRGNAAIVFFSSTILPLYAPIAIINTLTLSIREVSILALMCLISHNLPIECAVQHRSGTPMWKTAIIRLSCSILGAILLNSILPEATNSPATETQSIISPESATLQSALLTWIKTTLSLCAKIFFIITALMLVQEILKRYGIINKISRPLAPLMHICGLHPNSAFLWLVAQIVGLTYGAGIIAREIEESNANHEELHRLNLHISVNHSLIEDTAIFCMLGVAWYLLVIPRLIFAIIIVNLHNLVKRQQITDIPPLSKDTYP